jgi:CTP:phosphocholine cytidylyltransferase-like protein
MDSTDTVVKNVRPLQLPLIEIESTDGYVYTSDLSRFKSVYCFPLTQNEWNEVFQMEGDRIVWKNRFEVHIDQAMASIIKKTKMSHAEAS